MNKPTQLEMALLSVQSMRSEVERTLVNCSHDPHANKSYIEGNYAALSRVIRMLEKMAGEPESEPLPDILL